MDQGTCQKQALDNDVIPDGGAGLGAKDLIDVRYAEKKALREIGHAEPVGQVRIDVLDDVDDKRIVRKRGGQDGIAALSAASRQLIEDGNEVGADALAKSAGASAPMTAVYLIAALLNLPIDNILGAATPYVFVIVIFAVIAYHVTNLVTVYKAYAGICMPEDNRKREKKKRGFTDKLFDRIEERSREYQEYKLGRAKDDKNKKRRK